MLDFFLLPLQNCSPLSLVPWVTDQSDHTMTPALWLLAGAGQCGFWRRSEQGGEQLSFRPNCIGASWVLAIIISLWMALSIQLSFWVLGFQYTWELPYYEGRSKLYFLLWLLSSYPLL